MVILFKPPELGEVETKHFPMSQNHFLTFLVGRDFEPRFHFELI